MDYYNQISRSSSSTTATSQQRLKCFTNSNNNNSNNSNSNNSNNNNSNINLGSRTSFNSTDMYLNSLGYNSNNNLSTSSLADTNQRCYTGQTYTNQDNNYSDNCHSNNSNSYNNLTNNSSFYYVENDRNVVEANQNNNSNKAANNAFFTNSGVQGRNGPMNACQGECSVVVGAQNLMANYVPVFNPKGAMIDMYGPLHDEQAETQYREKIPGWPEAPESQEGLGCGNRNTNNSEGKSFRNQRARSSFVFANMNQNADSSGGLQSGPSSSRTGSSGVTGTTGNTTGSSPNGPVPPPAGSPREGSKPNPNSRNSNQPPESKKPSPKSSSGGRGTASKATSAQEPICQAACAQGGYAGMQQGCATWAAANQRLQEEQQRCCQEQPGRQSQQQPQPKTSKSLRPSECGEATNYEDIGECADFIDDEYKEARESARKYHANLSKIYETIKASLKPGPPIGSRWDAFKNAFKAGNVAQCPDLKISKEFDNYQQVLIQPGSPLDESVGKMSQFYKLMCSAKEALEHDIKTMFLNPLYLFLDKEWKDVVAHDKAVQGLATKIQEAKAKGKDHETIGELMDLFKHERSKTLYLFNYILNSDYSQILKFIDLINCYIDHHKESLNLLENLQKMLQSRARAAKPEDPVSNVKRQPLGPAGGMQGCLGTCTIPCKPPPGLVTDTKADTREVELEMQRIYGAKLPQRQMDCGHHGFGMTCAPDAGQMQQEKPPEESSSGCVDDEGSSAFLKYMENRIKTRPYGLVKEAYEASKSGELTLHVGEIIYLRGKPGFDRYCGEKEDGTKGTFPQKNLDVIVDIC